MRGALEGSVRRMHLLVLLNTGAMFGSQRIDFINHSRSNLRSKCLNQPCLLLAAIHGCLMDEIVLTVLVCDLAASLQDRIFRFCHD